PGVYPPSLRCARPISSGSAFRQLLHVVDELAVVLDLGLLVHADDDVELVLDRGNEIHHRQAVELEVAGERCLVRDFDTLLVERFDQRTDTAVDFGAVHGNSPISGRAAAPAMSWPGESGPRARLSSVGASACCRGSESCAGAGPARARRRVRKAGR